MNLDQMQAAHVSRSGSCQCQLPGQMCHLAVRIQAARFQTAAIHYYTTPKEPK